MIKLTSTLRGIEICANEPDARYGRFHTAFVGPDAPRTIGDAELVESPARYSDTGELLCSAGQSWRRAGAYVDPCIWPRCTSQGEDAGLRCDVIQPDLFAPTDPEVIAVRAELAKLDREWLAAHSILCAAEDARTVELARAYAHDDESGRPLSRERPVELECLECGAAYTEPGHVEHGGMSCDRCGS